MVRANHIAQDRWARPFGDFNHRWLSAVFRPVRPIGTLLLGVVLDMLIRAAESGGDLVRRAASQAAW